MSTAPQGWQNPKTTWQAADIVHPTDLNRIEGNIQAIETGQRTLDPSQAPNGNAGTLRQMLDWFANRIRATTGAPNWYDSPVITLAGAKGALDTHKASGDHDGRYYRKEEVDQLTAQQLWATPSSTWRATWTGDQSARGLHFFAPVPGRYRVRLVARAGEVWSYNIKDGGGYVTLGGSVFVAAEGVALSAAVSVTRASPAEEVELDMTLPGSGWLEIGLTPNTATIPHWEDPSEYPDEHLTGDVRVTEVRIGCDIMSYGMSAVAGEVRLAESASNATTMVPL